MIELDNLMKNKNIYKILFVDDKANMRRTLRNMLRTLGFNNFREAEDGDVAVKKIRSDKFDFVLCDWNMPRMSGIEVLREIRTDDRNKDLPFLMVTAEVEEATVAEVIEADVDGYIIKPFIPKTLEDKMIEILRKKLEPSPVDTQVHLAEIHLKARDYERAHQELNQAAKISPRSPRIHYVRGLTFEAQGDMDSAEKSFNVAKQVGPKFIKAHEKLAELYENQGRAAEMLNAIKEAVRVSPKNSERQTKLGMALLNEGRLKEATQAFNQALKYDPENAERQTAIGEAFLNHGLSSEAEKAFKASIKSAPDNVFVYNRLGIAFRRQKKFDEAITYYLKALEIDPYEENLLFNLARAYIEAGHKGKAVGALQTALKIYPEFDEARELLARLRAG